MQPLETGKRAQNSNPSLTLLPSKLKGHSKIPSVDISKPLFAKSKNELNTELYTTTGNNNTYYMNTVQTKESIGGTRQDTNNMNINNNTSSKAKMAPLNLNHKRTKSNYGEEIRQQIPELLKQIRSIIYNK